MSMRNGLVRNRPQPNSVISNNLGFIRRLEADDLKSCTELSVDRKWWPERDKWALLIDASEAYGVDAPDGRGLAGTIVLTRWGADRAAIGMVLVATRYGRQGLGRALMEHALSVAGDGVAVSLFATDSGKSMYEKLGFKPVRRNIAFRGRFGARPKAKFGKRGEAPADAAGLPGNVRVATEADLPAILTLDRKAYGADRERILSRLPAFAEQMIVLEGSDGIAAYAALWRTEAWAVIGPLVAPDGATARCLVTELAEHASVPVRVDLDPDRPELPGWVRGCGLMPAEYTVLMTRGDRTPCGTPEHVFTPISVAMA